MCNLWDWQPVNKLIKPSQLVMSLDHTKATGSICIAPSICFLVNKPNVRHYRYKIILSVTTAQARSAVRLYWLRGSNALLHFFWLQGGQNVLAGHT
jgi:hypothetical protein